MPNFKSNKRIELQPYSETVPYTFQFTVCSSATANDGDLPFGHSITACTVDITDTDGNDVAAQMRGGVSIASNIVTVPLTYPATSGAGKYKLTFKVETSGGMKEEFDFNRVYALDH